MNETAETVPASDHRGGHRANAHDGCLVDRAWRQKLKASVRPLVVVVPNVLVQNAFKVASAPDQHPVRALLPHSPYPPLSEGVGVRRLDRRLDGLDAIGGEDGVEGTGELAVAVMDEEPRCAGLPCCSWFSVHRELSCSLDNPETVRMVGDTDESNPPGAQLDSEQDVEGREAHRPDGEEVDCQDGRGLSAKERSPGDRCPSGRWPEPVAQQDCSDAGCCHRHPELL